MILILQKDHINFLLLGLLIYGRIMKSYSPIMQIMTSGGYLLKQEK